MIIYIYYVRDNETVPTYNIALKNGEAIIYTQRLYAKHVNFNLYRDDGTEKQRGASVSLEWEIEGTEDDCYDKDYLYENKE